MATRTTDLFSILEDAGISRLHEGQREISGSCPMHEQRTGRPDRHPSWSINKSNYLHFCHSCKYGGTLQQLLVDLTGAAPDDVMGELSRQSFIHKMVDVRERPEETLDPILTDWILRYRLKDMPEKLLGLRWLRREAIDRYGVRWDPDTRRTVMPLRTPDGELLGAQYRNSASVLTLPKTTPKSTTLFGYCEMCEFDECVLVESPLDAVRLYGLGIPAVSSLGSWVSVDQATLLARAFSVVYLALDDDKAGWQGAEIATRSLRRRGCAVVQWAYQGLKDESGKKAKDVGDVPSDQALLNAWQRTLRWGL